MVIFTPVLVSLKIRITAYVPSFRSHLNDVNVNENEVGLYSDRDQRRSARNFVQNHDPRF